jgi:hypothetical protein
MTKTAIFITVFFLSYGISAQEFMKKVHLKEGAVNNIKHNDLNISTLLQVYNGKWAEHLIGDIYLRVDNNYDLIAEFYVDNDNSTKEHYTRIYKNYFLTFVIENKYLVIEQAQFGKVFALSSNGSSIVGNKDNLVELEITDFVQESGYDAPDEDKNRSYFNDVHYSLQVKVGDVVKSFSFYSSEIKGDFTVNIDGYSILIISDTYKDSLPLIEMIVNKK